MREIDRINELLRLVYQGEAWYGPALREALAGVTAAKAATRPPLAAHSIWEIVLHVTAWQGEVHRRLIERFDALPRDGDWPEVTETSEAAWQTALQRLEQTYQQLRECIAGLTDENLEEVITPYRDRPTGSGVSIYNVLHGLIQHHVYHTGQIVLLKK